MVSVSKALRIAVLGVALLASVPSYAADNIFKSSEFLTWTSQSQEFYIRTSVGMASLIVGQTDKAQGKCVDDWYFGNEPSANKHIFDVMRRHSEFHPRGVILAVLEKKCGKFAYQK
jgi:hypothetical protein